MNSNYQIHKLYTDAPALHPNLILGTLHLLFWSIFHPSAWRNHVARLDSTLPADFTLVGLNRTQWRNPALQRLLIQTHLVLPLMAGLMFYPVFWFGNVPTGQITGTLMHFTTIVLVMTVLFGAVMSVGAGMVGGLAMGVSVALAGSLIDDVAVKALVTNFAIGAFIGLAGGINNHFIDQKQAHSPARQIGGIVIGILIGVFVILTRMGLTALGETGGLSDNTAYFSARSLIVGLSFGLALGWQRGWRVGVISGVTIGLFYNIALNVTGSGASDVVRGLASGALFGASLTASFVLPYVLAKHIAGFWAGAWAGALASYGRHIVFASIIRGEVPVWPILPFGLLGVITGLTITWWRPILLYPLVEAWNLLLYRADERRSAQSSYLLHRHSAFWDEGQFLRLHGLDDHLPLVIERNPAEGLAALNYLAISRQRWAARSVQIELDARRLENCAGVMAIREIHRDLAVSELSDSIIATMLRSFSHISQDVDAALNQSTAYNQRQALNTVEERLDALLRELTRSGQPYAVRFQPIATRWRQIIADRIRELATTTEMLQEINSPYVIGMPLTEQQEVFIGRAEISTDIEQFLLDRLCPPLFLYGQRRMGKTSLLNNLGRLLPSTILPMFVDLQGPVSWANDHAGFLYGIAQAMITSAERQRNIGLPPLNRQTLAVDPFIQFDAWLNTVEQSLSTNDVNTVLLALDEFEALDDALNKGRFDEQAILGMLRHLIQHRPDFKVLLAGSHTLEEFQRWASYLINVRLIHLGYLNETETCQLIEQPIKAFALRYKPEASRRVREITRGHPFLVQLLCSETITLKNKQEPAIRRVADLDDVEVAVEKALDHGGLYFADIYYNQIDEAGQTVLGCLATRGENATLSYEDLADQFESVINLDQTLNLLLQRELIEARNGGYQFQIELIRRWFAQMDGQKTRT